jgi:GlpG protein
MRQIATLPDEAARKLADYLLTLDIETRLQPEDQGTGVWVCDEDHLGQARAELEAFQRNPADTRYRQASAEADLLRWQQELTEQEYREQQEHADEQVARTGTPGPRPVTLALVAATVLVAVTTQLGTGEIVMTQELRISTQRDWPHLGQVAGGEVWRLVTPIFLHFSPMHLIFNLLMFVALAGQIESLRGSARLLALTVVLAIVSNLTQYYFGHMTFEGFRPILHGSSNFGGLSGVVYGLFGYIWVKSRLEPWLGLSVTTQTVVILLGWFFLCLFMDDVANGAHAGGLVAGLVLGLISVRKQP